MDAQPVEKGQAQETEGNRGHRDPEGGVTAPSAGFWQGAEKPVSLSSKGVHGHLWWPQCLGEP